MCITLCIQLCGQSIFQSIKWLPSKFGLTASAWTINRKTLYCRVSHFFFNEEGVSKNWLTLVSVGAGMTKTYPWTYLSIFVHFIVGQLDFFEGDDLFSQLVASKGRVWMGVKSVGRWWIGLAGYQPWWSVVGVSVPFVVTWHNIKQDPIPLIRSQVEETASHSGKHSPVQKNYIHVNPQHNKVCLTLDPNHGYF